MAKLPEHIVANIHLYRFPCDKKHWDLLMKDTRIPSVFKKVSRSAFDLKRLNAMGYEIFLGNIYIEPIMPSKSWRINRPYFFDIALFKFKLK